METRARHAENTRKRTADRQTRQQKEKKKAPTIFRIFGNERKLRQLEIAARSVFMRRASCATKQPPLQ